MRWSDNQDQSQVTGTPSPTRSKGKSKSRSKSQVPDKDALPQAKVYEYAPLSRENETL